MRQLITAILTTILLISWLSAPAQENGVWTLQQAVQYALDHNLSIRQDVLNARLSKLSLQQSRLSQIPNVNLSSAYGRSFGRSVDPTTNQFVNNTSYDFASLSANADVLIFGWFQKRNTIAKNNYSWLASQADLDQLKDDISLNVATGYLRALLAQEQVRVNQKQVELSRAQLNQTKHFAEAGRLPELNVAQLEAQLANDSANLIQAISDHSSAILDIKALLNFDFDEPFQLEVPDVKMQDKLAISDFTPEDIYNEATKHFGSIRSSSLKLSASEKGLAAAKGTRWPQLAINAQAGTNYATTYKDYTVTGITPTPISGSYALDTFGGHTYQLYQASPVYSTSITPLSKQFNNNFRQTISLGLNIPVFNAWQAQTSVKQAKINVLSQQLNKEQAELKLKQDVYKAYNDARNSIQKYSAAERAATAAQRAFDLAQKRYDLGLTNTVEYLTTQNTLYSSESKLAAAKYDLIFKLKVIDYYLGKEIKL
jgi:outer membrane protein